MRKNVLKVLEAFYNGKSLKVGSIRSTGNAIYSYNTCIAVKVPTNIVDRLKYSPFGSNVIVNITKYSPTTSNQQNSIKFWLDDQGFKIIEVDNLGFNVDAEQLILAYK